MWSSPLLSAGKLTLRQVTDGIPSLSDGIPSLCPEFIIACMPMALWFPVVLLLCLKHLGSAVHDNLYTGSCRTAQNHTLNCVCFPALFGQFFNSELTFFNGGWYLTFLSCVPEFCTCAELPSVVSAHVAPLSITIFLLEQWLLGALWELMLPQCFSDSSESRAAAVCKCCIQV